MADEQPQAPVDTGSAPEPAQAEPVAAETTEPVAEPTSPAESTTAETTTDSEPSPSSEVTEPSNEPDASTPTEKTDDADKTDVKGMTREERAEYFKRQQQQHTRQVEQAFEQAYQPQPVDELTEYFQSQGYSDGEAMLLARDEVRSQQAQLDRQRADIAELNSTLLTEAMEVVNTTPWLDNSNKEAYDQKSADAVSQLYEALAVEKDERTGQVINAKMSPKEFYALMDQVRQSGAAAASAQARKDAEAEMASVAPPSSTTNKRETSFSELSVEQQRQWLRDRGHDI